MSQLNEFPKNTSHFMKDKPGMNQTTREEINKIIEELTKGSVYYNKHIEEKTKIDNIVRQYKLKLQDLYKDIELFTRLKNEAELRIDHIRKNRNTSQICFHLDMDMFFAAVEIRDNPHLEHLPVAVGDKRMIATSNYVARKFGVVSALPGFIAIKLCPDLIIIKPNMEKYQEASGKIMRILSEYDNRLEVRSLDEANLNMTPYFESNSINVSNDSIMAIINEMKSKIYSKTKLTASIGVASNKILSKIASDKNKPNGAFIVERNEDAEELFMKDLKIRKIPGIGDKSEMKYQFLGYNKVSDLLEKPTELYYLLNIQNFDILYKSALGISSNSHNDDRSDNKKSYSRSKTFNLTYDFNYLSETFHELVDELFEDLLIENIIAKTISVEVLDANLEVMSLSKTKDSSIETKEDILKEGFHLMHNILKAKPDGIRLLRVKLSKLEMLKNRKRGVVKEVNIKNLIKTMSEVIKIKEVSKEEKNLRKNLKNIKSTSKNKEKNIKKGKVKAVKDKIVQLKLTDNQFLYKRYNN